MVDFIFGDGIFSLPQLSSLVGLIVAKVSTIIASASSLWTEGVALASLLHPLIWKVMLPLSQPEKPE
jgi:hypothetical protein